MKNLLTRIAEKPNFIPRFSWLVLTGFILFTSNALAQPKICFPPHEGLPYSGYLPPTVDGYVEPERGVLTTELEQGWTRSGRITYVGDTLQPLMVAQTIKHNSQDYIFLSFDVRNDEFFDADDVIVLVLRPAYFKPDGVTTPFVHTADVRRIDIFPAYIGVGAGPASEPDDTPSVPAGAPPSSTYKIRTNRDARNVEYYRWEVDPYDWTKGQWINMGADSVSNVEIKVRSWDLGSNQKNWSVEVRLPTKKTGVSGGGVNWINLSTHFGLYFNVIRVCGTGLCASGSIPVQTFASNQFAWPRADYATFDRIIKDPDTGAIPFSSQVIPASWLGHAVIGSSTSDCRGVRFVAGRDSIGVRNPADSAGPLSSSIDAIQNNIFVARVINDGMATADGVRAQFRIANWGIGGADATWEPLPRPAGPPTGYGYSSRQLIPTGGLPVELTLDWQLTSTEKARYCNPNQTSCPAGALWSHQCLWVTLDSNQNVDFSEASVRRNMNFVGLSRFRDAAEISAKGYQKPPGRDTQEFLLRVNKIRIPSFRDIDPKFFVIHDKDIKGLTTAVETARTQLLNLSLLDIIGFLRQRESKDELSQWVWTMHGHRNTQATLTMNNTRYAIYEPVGGVGYFAEHKGAVKKFKSAVQGQDDDKLLKNTKDPDTMRLNLKPDEVYLIVTTLEAKEPSCCWPDIPCHLIRLFNWLFN